MDKTVPCNCTGVRTNKCSCKAYGYQLKNSWTQNGLFSQNKFGDKADRIDFLRMLERLYDNCAGYNLRYCPLRRGLRRDKHLKNAAKDLMILVCFIFANFVVFLTIATRMVIHVSLVLRETFFWLQSYIMKSVFDEPIVSDRTSQADYSPPIASTSRIKTF